MAAQFNQIVAVLAPANPAELQAAIPGGILAPAQIVENDHGILAANAVHFASWLREEFSIKTTLRKTGLPSGGIPEWTDIATAFWVLNANINPHPTLKTVPATQIVLAFAEFMIPRVIDMSADRNQAACERDLIDALNNLLFGPAPNAAYVAAYGGMYHRGDGAAAVGPRPVAVVALDADHTAGTDDPVGRIANIGSAMRFIRRIFDIHADPIKQFTTANVMLAMAAFCCRGTISENKAAKIAAAAQTDHRINMTIQPEIFERIYPAMDSLIRRFNVNPDTILASLASVATAEISMRFHLVVQQAAHSGGSAIGIIASAMSGHARHPVWKVLLDEVPNEVSAFVEASRTLATDKLVGFRGRDQTERVKATKFPNLIYAATRLKVEMENSTTIRNFRNSGGATKVVEIDAIIKKHKENIADSIDLAALGFQDGETVSNAIADLSYIANSLN